MKLKNPIYQILNTKYLLLIVILCLAACLRFYKLGQVPAGLEWDEVAIGYDAYSILKTGRDQFGQLLPITFRSLDDYKPPLYEYLAVIPIAIFGLNAFAVRFPTALLGTLSVWLTYLLVKELFRNKDHRWQETAALLSAALLAISPWHLQFSRAAFEVNLSVFVVLMSVWTFLKGLRDNRCLYLTALFAGLGLFSYHSTRVVLPLLMIFLTWLFWRQRPKFKKLIGPILVFSVFLIPYLTIFFSPETQMRLRVTGLNNLFTTFDYHQDLNKNLAIDVSQPGDFKFRIFHGQKLILFRTFFDNYVSHFEPEFLFSNADVPLHHAPGFGLLYRTEALFLLIGFVAFFKKYLTKTSLILPFWFFIAPLPAAVTLQVPHAVRAELFLPTWQIFMALGLVEFFSWVKSKGKLVFLASLILVGAFFSYDFASYLHQYYVHTNWEVGDKWLDCRQQAVEFTEAHKQDYERVTVSLNVDMPWIFWLFYTQYDPQLYLEFGGTISGGYMTQDNKFDKYEFHVYDYETIPATGKTMLVNLAQEFPPDAKVLKTIYYSNGQPAIKIVEK